jgi:hypothetical protein
MERIGRKRSWPNLRNYPSIWQKGLGKTWKTCQDSWASNLDLNSGPPEYKAGITTRLRHLVPLVFHLFGCYLTMFRCHDSARYTFHTWFISCTNSANWVLTPHRSKCRRVDMTEFCTQPTLCEPPQNTRTTCTNRSNESFHFINVILESHIWANIYELSKENNFLNVLSDRFIR